MRGAPAMLACWLSCATVACTDSYNQADDASGGADAADSDADTPDASTPDADTLDGATSDADVPPDAAPVLNGTLKNLLATAPPGVSVRVALVWFGGAGREAVAEELANSLVSPDAFSLSLSGPPADETLAVRFGSRLAVANVVAYADTNGNGQLDLPRSFDDTDFDPILGVEHQYSILYVEGAPLSLGGDLQIPTGYSQVQVAGWKERQYCQETQAALGALCLIQGVNSQTLVRPVTSTLELTLDADVQLSEASCRELELAPGPASRSARNQVVCHADGSYRVNQSFGPLIDVCLGGLITGQEVPYSSHNVVSTRCLSEQGKIDFDEQDFAFDPLTQVHVGSDCRPFDKPVWTAFEPAPLQGTADEIVANAAAKLDGSWIGRATNRWDPGPRLVQLTFRAQQRDYQAHEQLINVPSATPFYWGNAQGIWSLETSSPAGVSGRVQQLGFEHLRFDAAGNRAQFEVTSQFGTLSYDIFRTCPAP